MGTGTAGIEFMATVLLGYIVFGQFFGMVGTVANWFGESEKVVV